MPDDRDEYYRPWADSSPIDGKMPGDDGAPDLSVFAPSGTASVDSGNHTPQRVPARRAGQFADQVKWAARTTRNGWNAFANTTIRLGDRANVPTRIAELELGRKSAAAGRTGWADTQFAGRQTAKYASVAYKATTPILAAAITGLGMAAIAAVRGVASAVGIVARRGGQFVSGAAGAIGEQAGNATRAIASKANAASARLEPSSQLDRLIEQDGASGTAILHDQARSPDLPLFSELVEPAAPIDPVETWSSESATATPVLGEALAPPASTDSSPGDPPRGLSALNPEARRKAGYALAVVVAIVLIAVVLARLLPAGTTSSTILASPTVAPIDAEAALASLDDGERAQIEAVVEAYILAHPEILPRAMERLQQREAGAAIGQLRDQIERPFAGAWAGNARGDVVVTEFSDFACGFCRTSVADVERLIKADTGVKIVYRELPILSNQSGYAARVALAAARRGRYRDFHLTLFGLGQPTDANIAIAAEKAGVSLSEQVAAKTRPEYGAEIERNITLMRQLNFEGTPSFVVGDRVLNGAVGYDALVRAVAEARSTR